MRLVPAAVFLQAAPLHLLSGRILTDLRSEPRVVWAELGVVGAGGIGQVLFEAIRGFHYPPASAILIIVVATVTLMDLVSQASPSE